MKPKEERLIKVKAPFIDETSGLAIVKILDGGTLNTLLIKLKFTYNTAILDVVNNGTETMIFRPEEMLEIVDLRSLGYYKINKVCYNKTKVNITDLKEQKKLCEYFNNFVNTLKKEREQKLPE